MKENVKLRIHRLNNFLNSPKAVILVLILLFGFFAYGNAQFNKQNQLLLTNTKQSVDNSNTIIKNLQQAVNDLKYDNARQTRYISCLLAIAGQGHLVDDSVKTQCQVMSQHVDLSDVTRTPLSTSPKAQQNTGGNASTSSPTNQNQNPTAPVSRPAQPIPTPTLPSGNDQPIKILGVPVCVPLTNVCVK